MSEPIPFRKEFGFEYGVLTPVAPKVRRLIAHNPSPFTFTGTGTYVVGSGRVAVIDPGPLAPEHVQNLLRALGSEEVAHILITHTHVDHSPAAQLLAAATGAPTFGFGPHARGRHQPEEQVEAGADWDFVPDHVLEEGDSLEGGDYRLEALHTPGHCSNHLCFSLADEQLLFTGDHVMGWSTTVIAPPDGDMGQYMHHLRRLLGRDDRSYLPTHGALVDDPKPLVAALVRHRESREQELLTYLAAGPARIAPMVETLYAAVPSYLHPAAARSMLASLLHLQEQGRVKVEGEPGLAAEYRLP